VIDQDVAVDVEREALAPREPGPDGWLIGLAFARPGLHYVVAKFNGEEVGRYALPVVEKGPSDGGVGTLGRKNGPETTPDHTASAFSSVYGVDNAHG
jgi:hypothetical protein